MEVLDSDPWNAHLCISFNRYYLSNDNTGEQSFCGMVNHIECAPPLRLTIDCSDERTSHFGSSFRSPEYKRKSALDVDSFCSLIHNAIPKAVHDGKFILLDPDQDLNGYSDTQVPMAIAPPTGFIPTFEFPKLKIPKIRIPKMNMPKLQTRIGVPHKAPRVGSPMSFRSMIPDHNSSAEKMEKLKKGLQKMLHFVKVLGQIDHYLSERIRIVVDKVSKTFAE